MTDSTPGTDLELRPPAAPARANIDHDLTDSWVQVMRPIVSLSEHVCETEFVPKGYRKNAPAVAAAILHGRELGLPPMTALALTDPIEGKPSMKAEGLRALVFAAGHDLDVPSSTGAQCTMRGRRRGSQTWTEVTWTIDMARAAGLASKAVWKNYPRAMLQARATGELCRLIFPDVIHGMGLAEELADQVDGDEPAGPGAATETSKTTVARAPRRSTAKASAPSGESGVLSTPATPLDVDIPMPDAPAPSGPESPPGPEVEEPSPSATSDEGPDRATDAEVVAQAAAEAPELDQPAQVIQHSAPKVTASQLRMLGVTWKKLGVTEDEDRRNSTEALIGRVLDGGTTKDLTTREASRLIDQLTKLAGPDQLDDLITRALSEQADQ